MKGRKFSITPFAERRNEKDEDLVLFRELNKREKDRFASLLQPVSDEFEPNGSAGNYALYRIASGKKGNGHEFLGENNKNDYDWLKTPPATPLFPSLEMEAKAAEQGVVQRELPILQPLSRFAGYSAATTKQGSMETPKSPKLKNKIPVRSTTPSRIKNTIQNNSSTETRINRVTTTFPNFKTAAITSPATHLLIANSKRSNTKESREHHHLDFITSNLSKNLEVGLTDKKPKPAGSRGVSPSTRPTITPAHIPGFPNEPPPNLRADRSSSATRGRPMNMNSPSPSNQRPKSVTRSRKVVDDDQVESDHHQKGKLFQRQILGSRMVEKVMNARKSAAAEERESKAAPNNSRGSNNNNNNNNSHGQVSPGFITRNMMPRSSIDTPLKHNMVSKRDGTNTRHPSTARRKSLT